ncbi:MAG: hypothetical protein BVN35_11110 [Proteobacteria bacterium ST_bin11]|jgi:MoaA/NifB/PqqE/SkfB family radical SAM enzyme|nr:MAG: hypothetical protein BVN35_11110 [Proteobacteria bacterium ST_bin11]
MRVNSSLLTSRAFPTIFGKPKEILGVNLGYFCHVNCLNCPANAESKRTQRMNYCSLAQLLAFNARLLSSRRSAS